MAQSSDPQSPSLVPDTDYRRLLREAPADDSSTDQDDLADDLTALGPAPEIDVIGISISHAQTVMKSPETPAVEKQRVLHGSEGYSNDEPIGSSIEADSSAPPATSPKAASPTETPPKPWSPQSSAQQPRRSSIMRSILGEGGVNRRRAYSGPMMLEAIKKMLPDLSSVSEFRSNGESPEYESAPRTNESDRNSSSPYMGNAQKSSQANDFATRQSRSTVNDQLKPPPAVGLDGIVESLLSPTSPRSSTSLRRSSSDGSLYLHRRVTAASAFDDTTAFGDVTEMTNARFKAISDSLQNSTLRLPRLPTIKYQAKRGSDELTTSVNDLMQQNTQLNAQGYSRSNNYPYTNTRNIRQAKKLIEVENPQQRAHPILSEALAQTEGDLVIMGGYRGSVLRDAKPPYRQLWAPVKVGLNLRNVDLEVGLTREDEENAHRKIIPSGTLSHIGPIDICRRLLKHVKKCPNTRENKLRVHDWGYDWRLSPDLLAERLIQFLEGLECNQPGTSREKRGAIIIAHSLGGLLTRWAVNQRPELFAGVVYAGVPQHCVNILGPLRNGDDVLLSSKVLTAQVNFTMRTSFALLPENGRCFINKHTNERYDLNLFDPQTWHDYYLSPCINPSPPPKSKEQRKSIMDSISDSLPSRPSVANKRGTWFGGNPNAFFSHNDTNTNASSDASSSRYAFPTASEATVGPTMKTGPAISSGKTSIATACTIPLPQAKDYLGRTLAEVLAFKRALVHRPSHEASNRYPPHAVIFGKTVPTVYGARVLSRDHIKYTDAFDDLAFAAGDGVVLVSSAQLPEGYRCVKGGRVETDRGHVGLLGDLEGVGKCLSSVVEGRRKGVGMGCFDDL